MDREIAHIKELIAEMNSGRDKAIALLASKVPLIISIGSMLLAAYAIFKRP